LNPAELFANSKVRVTEQELIEKKFKFLTSGLFFGFKKENDINTLVFCVEFLLLKPKTKGQES
jgi:hypothetical protein